MTNLLRLVALISLFAAPTFLAACHSDGIDEPDGGIDGGTDDASVALDGGTDDGGGDIDLGLIEGDGGTTPTGDMGINAIACGMMPCDTTANVCCTSVSMMMISQTCEPAAMCTMGTTRACDGPEDCTTGTTNTCCVHILGATQCQMKCNTGQQEACHTKTDCPAPAANRVAACCPVTATLRTCRTFSMGTMIPMGCD